jgi:2-hydroxychromene-2-carboxylate isomerase
MNERIQELAKQAGFQSYITTHEEDVAMFEKFAELVWKAAYEEGHDVGVDAGFEAGRNASFTERNFGVEEQ